MGKAWFVAQWVQTVLRKGLGFKIADVSNLKAGSHEHEIDLKFRPFGGIGKEELTWTLGKAVLYANKGEATDYEIKPMVVVNEAILRERDLEYFRAFGAEEAIREEEKLYHNIVKAASLSGPNRDKALQAAQNNARISRCLRRDPKDWKIVEKDGDSVGQALIDLAVDAHKSLEDEDEIRSRTKGEELKTAEDKVESSTIDLILAVKKAAGSLPANATVADL